MMADDKPQASIHVEDKMAGANELADWLDMSVKGVEALATARIAVRISHGKYLLKATIKNYVNHLRKAATGRDGATGKARSELLTIQAERQRFNLEVERGPWVKRADVLQEVCDQYRFVRSTILSAKSRIAGQLPHLMRQDLIVLDAVLREALTVLGTAKWEEVRSEQISDDGDHAPSAA
jgi:phage terminase Nu1 subunit (DNA packaging protein)